MFVKRHSGHLGTKEKLQMESIPFPETPSQFASQSAPPPGGHPKFQLSPALLFTLQFGLHLLGGFLELWDMTAQRLGCRTRAAVGRMASDSSFKTYVLSSSSPPTWTLPLTLLPASPHWPATGLSSHELTLTSTPIPCYLCTYRSPPTHTKWKKCTKQSRPPPACISPSIPHQSSSQHTGLNTLTSLFSSGPGPFSVPGKIFSTFVVAGTFYQ